VTKRTKPKRPTRPKKRSSAGRRGRLTDLTARLVEQAESLPAGYFVPKGQYDALGTIDPDNPINAFLGLTDEDAARLPRALQDWLGPALGKTGRQLKKRESALVGYSPAELEKIEHRIELAMKEHPGSGRLPRTIEKDPRQPRKDALRNRAELDAIEAQVRATSPGLSAQEVEKRADQELARRRGTTTDAPRQMRNRRAKSEARRLDARRRQKRIPFSKGPKV